MAPHFITCGLRNHLEYLISNIMPITVIDLLKMIDIKDQQTDWSRLFKILSDQLLHQIFKTASIIQAWQRVSMGEIFKGLTVIFIQGVLQEYQTGF